jgi:hypothetical protein
VGTIETPVGLHDLNLAVTSAGTLTVKLTQSDYMSYPLSTLYSPIGGA